MSLLLGPFAEMAGKAFDGISNVILEGRLEAFVEHYPASAGLLISGMIFAGVIFNFGFLKKIPDAGTWVGKLLIVTACFGFMVSLSWLGIAAAADKLHPAKTTETHQDAPKSHSGGVSPAPRGKVEPLRPSDG